MVKHQGASDGVAELGAQKTLSLAAVRDAYRRWAPVYDSTFGMIANRGRRETVHLINQRRGNHPPDCARLFQFLDKLCVNP